MLFVGSWVLRASLAPLACLRHAASVHPGPGSNPHIKIFKYTFIERSANDYTKCSQSPSADDESSKTYWDNYKNFLYYSTLPKL